MLKFLIIWNVCWFVGIPLAFWLAFRYGRKWIAKKITDGLMVHLRRRK